MTIKESAEDYLEAIHIVGLSKEHVRSIDIVKRLGLSKPSVSVAMKKLRENGYITMDSDGYIMLTEAGRSIAEKIYERHKFISRWLEDLGVKKETAIADACRIEHVLSDETFEAIKNKYDGNRCKDCTRASCADRRD